METDADQDSSKNRDSFYCAMCSEHFLTRAELKQHFLNTHKDHDSSDLNCSSQTRIERKFNRYLCKLCGKHFADPWSLNHHWKSVHNKTRDHKCSQCGKEFLSNKDMLRHYKAIHLKHKIVLPRSRQPTVTKFKISQPSKGLMAVSRIPNILKNSKATRGSSSVKRISTSNVLDARTGGSIVKIIGLEKSGDSKEGVDNNDDVFIELKETEVQRDEQGGSGSSDQPMFQLENLENLQLVLPEDSGEPRIIIPETGIRLTIPDQQGDQSHRKILHLIPDTAMAMEEDTQSSPGTDQLDHHGKHITVKKQDSVVTIKTKTNYEFIQQFNCTKCEKCFISEDFLHKHMTSYHAEAATSSSSNPINLGSIFHSAIEGIDLEGEQNLGSLDDIKLENLVSCADQGESSLLKNESLDVLLTTPGSKVLQIPDFSCNICEEKCESRQALNKHKRVAHKKVTSFKCDQCSSVYTSKQSLDEHCQSVHEGIKKVCSLCMKPVLDLTRHIRNQHKNKQQRNFPCDVCSLEFRTNYSLTRHRETVHMKVKAHTCDLCKKGFGEKRDMIRHRNSVHFGIKSNTSVWSCPECNVTFKLRKEYDAHKARHHANMSEFQIVKFLNSEMETKQNKKQSNNVVLV